VSINYTDPNLVQEVYMKNHEIASHTYSHVMNPGRHPHCKRKSVWLGCRGYKWGELSLASSVYPASVYDVGRHH
jgi:hypothetical protein